MNGGRTAEGKSAIEQMRNDTVKVSLALATFEGFSMDSSSVDGKGQEGRRRTDRMCAIFEGHLYFLFNTGWSHCGEPMDSKVVVRFLRAEGADTQEGGAVGTASYQPGDGGPEDGAHLDVRVSLASAQFDALMRNVDSDRRLRDLSLTFQGKGLRVGRGEAGEVVDWPEDGEAAVQDFSLRFTPPPVPELDPDEDPVPTKEEIRWEGLLEELRGISRNVKGLQYLILGVAIGFGIAIWRHFG